VFNNVIREILWLLSEIEARISDPNDPIIVRRLFLRYQEVKHGRQLWIGRSLRLNYRGKLVMGERCAIGAFAKIGNHAMITIGDDFLSAPGLTMDSGMHDVNSLYPCAEPIKIGNRVWCGVNVTILAGVTIGDDVILGAGCVVNKDIPSRSVAAGVPAKVISALERSPSEPLWSWCRAKQ
jgi:maltose O-acetyltransferase